MVHAQRAVGHATLRGSRSEHGVDVAYFERMQANFPLRLLCPHESCVNATQTVAAQQRVAPKSIGILYVVSFGGGLVCGDSIELNIDVGSDTRLLLLTQGSTKVYRERRGGDLPAAVVHCKAGPAPASQQLTRYIVRENATLILLPAPVTCFARSRYLQTQLVDLRSATTSSLVLLDWFTSGRLAVDGPRDRADVRIPELWHFYLYHSRNEVRVEGHVVARDRQQLEQALPENLERGDVTPLARRCDPYTCYALLLLYGVECEALCAALTREHKAIQQPQPLLRSGGTLGASHVAPPSVLWSASPLHSGAPVPGLDRMAAAPTPPGLVVRLAGVSTDKVRAWLYEHLQGVRHLIGDDMYHVALG